MRRLLLAATGFAAGVAIAVFVSARREYAAGRPAWGETPAGHGGESEGARADG